MALITNSSNAFPSQRRLRWRAYGPQRYQGNVFQRPTVYRRLAQRHKIHNDPKPPSLIAVLCFGHSLPLYRPPKSSKRHRDTASCTAKYHCNVASGFTALGGE